MLSYVVQRPYSYIHVSLWCDRKTGAYSYEKAAAIIIMCKNFI